MTIDHLSVQAFDLLHGGWRIRFPWWLKEREWPWVHCLLFANGFM